MNCLVNELVNYKTLPTICYEKSQFTLREQV